MIALTVVHAVRTASADECLRRMRLGSPRKIPAAPFASKSAPNGPAAPGRLLRHSGKGITAAPYVDPNNNRFVGKSYTPRQRNVTIKSSLLISLDLFDGTGLQRLRDGRQHVRYRKIITHGGPCFKANEGDMTGLPLSDRKRLAALLGMLGSTSSGERDNAARLAEQLRQRLGLTWEELLALDHADETAPTRREDQPEPIQPRREKPRLVGIPTGVKTGRSKFLYLEPRRVRCPHLWNNVRSRSGD